MLHSIETLDLASRPGLKAKFLSAGCEIVLLNSSSFKTHVQLLNLVIVNQALRLCSFSSFPSDMSFSPENYCVMYYCSVEMYVFVYLLHSNLILTNIKQETLLHLWSSHFFSLAWNLLLSAQRKQISHTSANVRVRLFVYFVCLCASEQEREWVSEWEKWVSEWLSKRLCAYMCGDGCICMRWQTQNWCPACQSEVENCSISVIVFTDTGLQSHTAGGNHTLFKPGLWCLMKTRWLIWSKGNCIGNC